MDSSESTPDKHKKTAKQQFEIYLEFVRHHALLKKGWNVQKMHMAELNDIWREMANKLNNCSGPSREMSHWKKVFTEWKSHTRRKLKYGKMLTDVEKDLIEVMGMCLLNEDEKIIKKNKALECVPKKKTVILQFPSDDSKTKTMSPNNVENDMVIKQEVSDFPNPSTEEEMETSEQEIGSKFDESTCKLNEASENVRLSSVQDQTLSEKEKTDPVKPEKEKPKQRRNSRKPKMISVSTNTSPMKQKNEEAKENTVNVGESLMAIANALNRYCGIIERRIF